MRPGPRRALSKHLGLENTDTDKVTAASFAEHELVEAMAEMDLNGDGNVDFEEFKK